jgi:hypothetical protein
MLARRVAFSRRFRLLYEGRVKGNQIGAGALFRLFVASQAAILVWIQRGTRTSRLIDSSCGAGRGEMDGLRIGCGCSRCQIVFVLRKREGGTDQRERTYLRAAGCNCQVPGGNGQR